MCFGSIWDTPLPNIHLPRSLVLLFPLLMFIYTTHTLFLVTGFNFIIQHLDSKKGAIVRKEKLYYILKPKTTLRPQTFGRHEMVLFP